MASKGRKEEREKDTCNIINHTQPLHSVIDENA